MWALVAALLFWQAPDYFSEGLKALDEGKHAVAAEVFAKAVAAEPKDYAAHFHLALALGYLHRDAEAVAEYRKALALEPGLFEAELNAGIVLKRMNKPSEALPLLQHAVEQKPAEFQPRFHLAEAQFATAAYGDAEVAYRAALERDPKVPEAELGLARTLVRQNRLTEAEPHYRRAAELDPGCRDELLVLAESYENSGETAKAMAIYREFPENAAVQAHVGEMMLDTREYEEAIPRLEQAFRKDATQANRTALAFAYRAGRKLDKALPLLAAAVAAEPADYDIRMMYARTLRDLRQFQAAGDQFLAALKLKPGEARTWTDYAGMRYMIGDYTEALKAYRTATDAGDQSAGIWFYSAIMLDKMKQLQPAMEAYRRFLSLSNGKSPNQEFQARTRAGIIQKELDRK